MDNSNLYQKVYEIVADIPEGFVATYGQIAWMSGRPRGARVIAYIMSRVPEELKLPCHRVVNKSGKLAPEHVFGGEEIQRAMLEKEGVFFLENGCIDMKKSQWGMFI
jgi:methylated-DNA-protein-cysteine methyltransferase-like protein